MGSDVEEGGFVVVVVGGAWGVVEMGEGAPPQWGQCVGGDILGVRYKSRDGEMTKMCLRVGRQGDDARVAV